MLRTRVIALLLAIAALVAFSVPSAGTPAKAQATPDAAASQTIADIVVASTKADKPEFTVLLAAVQAADPAFLTALSDAKGNYTVFAPTDAAFTAAIKALNTTAEKLLADKALLNVVLAYHVVPGRFDAKAVTGANGAIIGTLLADNALKITAADGKVQVDKSNVVTADVKASNGVVHVIDAVLLPENAADLAKAAASPATPAAGAAAPRTIAQIVIDSSKATPAQFTTLLAAIQAADPAVLAAASGGAPITVFAPTDAAFGTAITALNTTPEKLLADKAGLTGILLYHVAPGSLSSKALVKYLGTAESLKVVTLSGSAITVTSAGGKVNIDKAAVATADIAASNGIVHIIDGVLLPPAAK
jgi:transforming growth factor-beta-induced protein